MGSRRKGRILAFQALFSWDTNPVTADELLEFGWLDEQMRERYDEGTLAFARLIVAGALEHLEEVDTYIKRYLEHWDFKRIGKVDLAILRMSVYALKFQPDIPATVTIDEAVDIARSYGSDESYRFINGILDGILKSRHENE
jgi:transcription antitermination protein NusB